MFVFIQMFVFVLKPKDAKQMSKLYARSPKKWLKAMDKFCKTRDIDAFVSTLNKLLHSMTLRSNTGKQKLDKDNYQRWAHQGGQDRELAGQEWEDIIAKKVVKHAIGKLKDGSPCVVVKNAETVDETEEWKATGVSHGDGKASVKRKRDQVMSGSDSSESSEAGDGEDSDAGEEEESEEEEDGSVEPNKSDPANDDESVEPESSAEESEQPPKRKQDRKVKDKKSKKERRNERVRAALSTSQRPKAAPMHVQKFQVPKPPTGLALSKVGSSQFGDSPSEVGGGRKLPASFDIATEAAAKGKEAKGAKDAVSKTPPQNKIMTEENALDIMQNADEKIKRPQEVLKVQAAARSYLYHVMQRYKVARPSWQTILWLF